MRAPIERYTEEQLAHFIAFIQSPHITTDMPFGERKLKLSSGEKLVVPDVIRNIIPSQSPKRTALLRFEFGSVRLVILKVGSGSVRFDRVFKKSIRVRFGSTAFSKWRFGFGSDRFEPNRTA
jgi:hypothetical protein